MINHKAIGYITANYASEATSVLLDSRPIASIPFIGRYRLIDFPLSNMANAGIKTVGLVMPGNYRSIIDHVGHGKEWMLDRKKGGLFPVPGSPFGGTKRGRRFLLRDIIANKELFTRAQEPYVVMMGSNIIFNLELDETIAAHERSGAGITMVYVKAERSQTDCTSLVIGDAGRVSHVKLGCEYGDNKFLDCFIVNRDLLLQIIDRYATSDYLDVFEATEPDFSLIDVCSYEFKGLAMGIFDEKTYYERSMELLNPSRPTNSSVATVRFLPRPTTRPRRSTRPAAMPRTPSSPPAARSWAPCATPSSRAASWWRAAPASRTASSCSPAPSRAVLAWSAPSSTRTTPCLRTPWCAARPMISSSLVKDR